MPRKSKTAPMQIDTSDLTSAQQLVVDTLAGNEPVRNSDVILAMMDNPPVDGDESTVAIVQAAELTVPEKISAPVTETNEDIEAALAVLENEGGIAIDPVDELTEDSSVDDQAPQVSEENEIAFGALVDAVPDDERMDAAQAISHALDYRAEFETKKNPANTTIHATLNKSRAKLAMPSAAAVLLAAEVDLNFMNRQQSEGSGYNVYAVEKVADIVKALDGDTLRNAINIAVCRSLFRFRAAGETFTGEMAKAAASDKIRIQGEIRKLLVRHTVSASTAPTQSSSTMQALQTMGIVKNTGTMKHPAYVLTNTPQTKRLEEVCQKLAA